LDRVRHPIIIFAASRRAKWRAASRPSPMFAPVMRIVWPVNGVAGCGSVVKSWDFRKEVRKPAGLRGMSGLRLRREGRGRTG